MDAMFLHGRESGPTGSKIASIRAAGWTLTVPDCTGIEDVAKRVAIAREALEALEGPLVLVGSSMGGLTAALLWSQIHDQPLGEGVHGILLLAPALNWAQAEAIEHCHPNTVILHGVDDELVPIDASRAFASKYGYPLVEVDDTHRLKVSHPEILRQLEVVAGPG